MNYDSIMIHFGELSTKGNNRNNFVQRLTHNVRLALSRFPLVTCKGTRDHIYVYLNGESPDKVVARLSEVAGIQKMSLVRKVEPEENAIKEAALELVKGEAGKAFKVNVKRIDKTFPLRSYDLTVAIADYILENTNLSVDLHAYDFKLSVIIREDGVFLSCHEYLGLGGYPLGMNGKVIHLLSGGIDSPVAAYKLLRRG
ncbi:MAG: tRNA 4-thiouridine(8) synthase ThiI, partial [Bacilli bacterium]|nr:tRNA 4-thiouridine(8) synthase ThiI [Bacilli bacterium]